MFLLSWRTKIDEIGIIMKLPEYVNLLEEKDKQINDLQDQVNNHTRRNVWFHLGLDFVLAIAIILIGVLCVFWTNKSWNLIGSFVSNLFSDNSPLRINLLSSMIFYLLTSPILARRIKHNFKVLGNLRPKTHHL